MGRLLKHRVKDNKWRVWSTVSDQWITGWLTENETKRYVITELEYDYKVKVIERIWSFPHGYYDKDVQFKDGRPVQKMFNNHEAYIAFTDWHLEAAKSDDYYVEVDEKFRELMEGTA